jgi:hypothetical protein
LLAGYSSMMRCIDVIMTRHFPGCRHAHPTSPLGRKRKRERGSVLVKAFYNPHCDRLTLLQSNAEITFKICLERLSPLLVKVIVAMEGVAIVFHHLQSLLPRQVLAIPNTLPHLRALIKRGSAMAADALGVKLANHNQARN